MRLPAASWRMLVINIITSLFFFFFFQHFVSERKYDEDLGKAVRFTFDLEPLKTSISGFGSGTEFCLSPLYRLCYRCTSGDF